MYRARDFIKLAAKIFRLVPYFSKGFTRYLFFRRTRFRRIANWRYLFWREAVMPFLAVTTFPVAVKQKNGGTPLPPTTAVFWRR